MTTKPDWADTEAERIHAVLYECDENPILQGLVANALRAAELRGFERGIVEMETRLKDMADLSTFKAFRMDGYCRVHVKLRDGREVFQDIPDPGFFGRGEGE